MSGTPQHRLTLNIEAIAYHEGVPGHHLQISIAQELTDLPDFRRNGEYTAFVEGWALYAERLGKEIGFYQDPYSDYGRLENEMWRDIRLVIDTGVHEKHWSRDQMVDYFHRYTAMDEPNVQTRSGPLHCLARTGARLQAGTAGDSEAARRGAGEARREI